MPRSMNRRTAPAQVLAVLLVLSMAGCRGGGTAAGRPDGRHDNQAGPGAAATTPTSARWLCPMHPTYTSDRQRPCPICGMDLVEATAFAAGQAGADGSLTGLAALELDDRSVQLAGVRTQAAAVRPLRRAIRAQGTVTVDQTRRHSVQSRVAGWIETMAVTAVGEHLTRGGPLLTIYAPELVATQEELLRAQALTNDAGDGETRSGAAALADAARRRLRLLGVADDFIEKLERTGEVTRTVPLRSPATGVVTMREAYPGMAVEPGLELLEVTDLSAVWLDVRFYEYEARHVVAGRPVTVHLPHDPGLRLSGVIDYVYPTLDEATRTLSARVVLANDFGQLRPGLYADVLLEVDLGESLVIPDDAVLDTGLRQVVFVATGAGRFVPREVTVGDRAGGQAQILAGLEPGEQVVVKAAFLLDSESRIRAALLPAPGEPAAGGHHAGHDSASGDPTAAGR